MVQIVLELSVLTQLLSCMYVCVRYVWSCFFNQWAFYITLKCLKLDEDLTIVFLLFYFCYNVILSLGLRLFYVLCKARGLKWYKIQTNFIIHNIYWLNAFNFPNDVHWIWWYVFQVFTQSVVTYPNGLHFKNG